VIESGGSQFLAALSADGGLLALFLVSFLASTVLPLGSEWLLVAVILQTHEPWPAVVVATFGNSLGALTTYLLGLWGGEWFITKILRVSASERQRAEGFFQRYGSWSLLLTWVPVIGDPLCLVAGALRTRLARFLALMVAGKLARYAAVAWLVLAASNH